MTPRPAGRLAEPPPTAASVLRLWLPTALSTSVLVVEVPLLAALVARSGGGPDSLAAFGVVVAVVALLNSPGLPLSSTVAALGTSVPAAVTLRRYGVWLGAGVSLPLLAAMVTPLADVLLVHVLALPASAVPLARLGFLVTAPVPLLIAWRRANHGILITMRRTGPIATASAMRIVISVAASYAVLTATAAPGVVVGTIGFLVGAATEGVIVAVASRHFRARLPARGPAVGLRRAAKLHVPLAVAAVLSAVPQPLLAAGMARGADPEISLAGWPVVFGLVWLVAGCTLELQAVTTSVRVNWPRERATAAVTLAVGGALSAVLLLVVLSPAGEWYFRGFSALPPDVAAASLAAMPLAVVLPLVQALRAWLRGVLAARERALAVQHAMVLNLVTLAATFGAGLALLEVTALTLAVGALVAGLCVELLVLLRTARPGSPAPAR